MISNLAIIASTTLISYWTWSLFSRNLFVGLGSILLSFLLLSILNKDKFILSRRLTKFAVIGIWTILSAYLIINSFDKNLFRISENQYINILKRQEIYSKEFNYLYRNRFGVYYFNTVKPFTYRYISNISNIFDLEGLFLLSFEAKYKFRLPILLLPFLILGLYFLLKRLNKHFIYIAIIILVISGFLDTRNSLGPIIIYPIIYAGIGLGIKNILNLKK